MATNVSGVYGSSSATGTVTSSSSTLRTESSEFMLMLMAQLRNQNPLDPMQDKDMMGQVAQLNSLEELKTIRSMMQQTSQASESSYGMALIGKYVQANLDSGDTLEGVVTGATWENNKMFLQIGDQKAPLESIVSVEGEAP